MMAHPFSVSPSLPMEPHCRPSTSEGRSCADLGWFSARLEGETCCLLTGITCVNGFLLVVDNENKKLKRFDFDQKLVDHLQLSDPCGITCLLGSKHVVVTEPDFNQISFIATENVLSLSSIRKTKKKYESIAYFGEMKLLTGCCTLGEACVDIINSNGSILKSFRKDADGQIIFRNPASLSMMPRGDIIVSDSGHSLLICLTKNGEIEFTYDPGGRPSGVSNDGEYIYLCGYDGHAIQTVSTVGEKTRDLLRETDGLQMPLAIFSSGKKVIFTEEMPSDRVFVVNVGSCIFSYLFIRFDASFHFAFI